MKITAGLPHIAIFLSIALCGCGKKAPLIPPEALAPAPIRDLQAMQRGDQLQLSWSAPTRDETGSRLRDLAGFVLLRHEVLPPNQDCDTCPDAYRPVARLELNYPQGLIKVDDRYLFADRDITTGKSYRYKARSFKSDGTVSQDSNKVQRPALPPVPAPSLKADFSTAEVALTFAAPPVAEGTLVGYNVYRRRGEEAEPLAPANPAPLPAASYRDQSLQRGTRYAYRVTSVLRFGDILVESFPSAEAAGTLVEPQ